MSVFFSEPTESSKSTSRGMLTVETLHKMECKVCPLNEVRGLGHPKMEATGSKTPLIYCLGEAPGAEEDASGKQFVGDSGKVLRARIPKKYKKLLRWNNCVRTRPPKNRTPTKTEIECCRPSVVRDIERTKPKAIFGFGGVPLNWATGEDGIYKWRGRYMPLKVGDHVCWFFPMLHPSGLLRQRKKDKRTGRTIKSEAEKTFERDLRRAIKLVKKLPPPQVLSPYKDPSNTTLDTTDPAANFKGVQYVTGAGGDEDVAEVERWLRKFSKEKSIAIDIETASKERMKERQTRPYSEGAKILSVAVATSDESFAFPLRHREAMWSSKQLKQVEKLLVRFLTKAKGDKVAHNLVFELEWLCFFFGLDFIYKGTWGDTMAQAYVLDERRGMLSLDSLTIQHFGFSLKSIVGLNLSALDNEPLELVLTYNALDSLFEHKLYVSQRKLLRQQKLSHVYEMHVPPIATTALTQLFGNEIDFERVLQFDKKYSRELLRVRKWIAGSKSAAKFKKKIGRDFVPSSHPDAIIMLQKVLKREEGLYEDANGKKKYKADDETLTKINNKFSRHLQTFRALNGNKSKYVDPIHPETGKCIFPDGRIHPNIHTLFTDTGRTSSSFPNEQFWPKRDQEFRDLRSVFSAREDCYYVAIDQGQIEARVIEMAAKDRRYGSYLWDRHDIHMEWTERLAYAYPRRIGGKKFIKDKDVMKWFRNDVKNQWTFPLFFGANSWSVSNYLNMPREVIDPMVDKFWQEFAAIKEWQEELEEFYNRHGYVECLTGRRRRNPISHNELINSPIQGTASDITVRAYSRLSHAAWELDMWQFQARLEVHDELVFEIPKKTFDRDVQFVADYMLDCEHFDFINVPLCIEISRGPNWFAQEPVMTLFSDDLGKLDRKACGF